MKTQSRISRRSTLAMWIAAVTLLGVFVFPLWEIHLHAPQYPQGLGLHIWIDRVAGESPHDLQNINGLNHYIGMAKIEPGAIPELRFMKYFAMGLAGLAAAVGLCRRKWALTAWVVLALVLSGVGMWDFYKWEYNYGHNLNPDAAIKVPGMSYQPPMFGTRQLLNFRTAAWPGAGGWLAMVGVGLGAACAVYEIALRRRQGRSAQSAHPRAAATAAAGLVLLAVLPWETGCARRVQAIAYGVDACEHCSMTISDDRHGAAILTAKGRTHKFDSVECMLQWAAENGGLAPPDGTWFVTDYAHRGTLVAAGSAAFLVSPNLPSPMGAGLTAFAVRRDAERVRAEKGGRILDWKAVQDYAGKGIKLTSRE